MKSHTSMVIFSLNTIYIWVLFMKGWFVIWSWETCQLVKSEHEVKNWLTFSTWGSHPSKSDVQVHYTIDAAQQILSFRISVTYNCWMQSFSRGKIGPLFPSSTRTTWTYLLSLLWTSSRTGIWALFFWLLDFYFMAFRAVSDPLPEAFPLNRLPVDASLMSYLSLLFTMISLFVFPVSALISGHFGLHCLTPVFSDVLSDEWIL